MDELTQLLSDLVAINSINPDLVPGAAGEARIARFIADWLKRAGVEAQLIDSAAGRPNVVGMARGTGGGKTLMLNGHMDTVGVGDMPSPHEPRVSDGRLYGRGAYDMKGGLAACMTAMAAAAKQRLRGDVIFAAVVDEEYASIGTADVAKQFRADGAIVAEFTELNLVLAHKGFVWFEIETHGKAAHGSRPDLGVDAIAKMGPILEELTRLDQALRAEAAHPLLGSGSIHASLIKGGQELSSYPDHCVLSVERRTLPGETPEMAESQVVRFIRDIERRDPSFKADVRRGLARAPLETKEDVDIVRAVQAAAEKVMGHAPAITGVPFWTDAALLSAAGVPSLLFGPAGAGAHSAEEWVDLASVKTCAEIYLGAALAFCA